MTRSVGITLVLIWAAAACAAGASTDPSLAPATAAGSQTVEPTAGTSSLAATEAVSAASSSATSSSDAIPGPSGTPAPLPLAEIVTGHASIAGGLGTYTLDGYGSDAPWLPFGSLPTIAAGAAERLTFRFVDGAMIGDAQVIRAAAGDSTGAALAVVPGSSLGSGGTSLSVNPLPVGHWVVAARLFRADGRGDGTTFWAVIVR